jgi:hypothetical protein
MVAKYLPLPVLRPGQPSETGLTPEPGKLTLGKLPGLNLNAGNGRLERKPIMQDLSQLLVA